MEKETRALAVRCEKVVVVVGLFAVVVAVIAVVVDRDLLG